MTPVPRKRFGQHWLQSEAILHEILTAAEVSRQDSILEIGPGTGVLTRWLVSLAGTVVAVEIDRDLCRRLNTQFADVDHFHLVSADILELDLQAPLTPQPDLPPPNKVVANIPYYITGPILEKLLGSLAHPNPHPYDTIVLLVQRELADRLYAMPGTRAFGALSVRVQYLAECELICPVPAKAFQPPPKVDSAVVRLRPRQHLPPVHNPQLLEQIVRAGFASKRKMLRNNLKALVDRDWLTDRLLDLGAHPQVRAEDISVAQWVALSNKIQETRDSH